MTPKPVAATTETLPKAFWRLFHKLWGLSIDCEYDKEAWLDFQAVSKDILNPIDRSAPASESDEELWTVRETEPGLDYCGQKTGWIICNGRQLNGTPISLSHCQKFAVTHNAAIKKAKGL